MTAHDGSYTLNTPPASPESRVVPYCSLVRNLKSTRENTVGGSGLSHATLSRYCCAWLLQMATTAEYMLPASTGMPSIM